MIKEYYALTKPGLIYGNLISVIGGFALAVRGHFDFVSLFAAIIGIALVMASGCVFNNIIDRDIDGLMERTKKRSLVEGRISTRGVELYGVVLGIAGFLILAAWTNFLTVCAAAFGFAAYVFLYSLWLKRSSVHGTLAGALAGAVPPVVGYTAASDRFDGGAILLFLILVLWQMPHFYAIAIYRSDDYASAGVPVLPVKRGILAAKKAIVAYITFFFIAVVLLGYLGYAGVIYLVVAIGFAAFWLISALQGFMVDNSGAPSIEADKRWARSMFLRSLIVLVAIFAGMTIDSLFFLAR